MHQPVLFLYFYFLLFTIQAHAQQLEIIPNDTERVVEAGSNFTLTCTYQYVNEYDKRENHISWILPNYLTKNPKSDVDKRLLKILDRNDTHLTSTIILMNSRPEDTGYFGCIEILWSAIGKISQYVYFSNEIKLITIDKMDNSFPAYEVRQSRQGEPLLIPCKPTHPNVAVSLSGREISADRESDWEHMKDFLSEPDSNWSFQPDRGLTLKNPKINDSGEYRCGGQINQSVYYEYFSIYVIGLELTRIDQIDDPLEAWLDSSNVTFICRTSATSEFPSQPEWAFQTDDGDLKILNKSNSPIEGIHVRTTNYYSRMGYSFYESQLDLFDIASQIPYTPWNNTSTIFQCTANIDGHSMSKKISLTTKEINFYPEVYSVRYPVEKGSVVVAFSATLAILFVVGVCIAVKPYFDKKRRGFRERTENHLDSPTEEQAEEQTELIMTTSDSQDKKEANSIP